MIPVGIPLLTWTPTKNGGPPCTTEMAHLKNANMGGMLESKAL